MKFAIATAATTAALGGLMSFEILSQSAVQFDPSTLVKDLMVVWGPVGVLAWYLYYTTSVAFPRISGEHLAQLEKLDSTHRADLSQQMELWRKEIREDRVEFRQALERMMESLRHSGCGWSHKEQK